MSQNVVKPVVGMGATKIMHSDRHPYTVIEVINERRIRVQADTSHRVDTNGMSDCQEYTYAPNPDGEVVTLSLRKDDTWRVVGDSQLFSVGHGRHRYYDYSY